MHTLFGTGYTHGASRVNTKVIFCTLVCIFTNNIHSSVKNSSAEGTCTKLESICIAVRVTNRKTSCHAEVMSSFFLMFISENIQDFSWSS